MAGLTREEAKRSLLDQMLDEARHDAAKSIRQIESEAREEADRRAKKIVSIAIERLAGEFVAERTVSVVTLPSDDMKGRIIGREGRNIRAIEAATGVDLIIDDTPEAVVISCHNPIRRELARLALEKLLSDGRIHPARIEEVVRRAEQELDEAIREAGQRAVIEVGVHGIHPELVSLVGMLKYRYSYAQNVLMHSIEAAFIAGAMAAELGLNEKQARRAALLHDIGKALTHEVEGSHAIVGGEIARKYGESAKIVNAIAAHHEEVKAETILAPLVDAADALSGARPGARREVLESYVKRLEDLERISNSFKGVEKSFAVQAGREIRIIVDPGADSRRPGGPPRPGRGAQDRAGDDLPGADQGDGHPRDAGERSGAVNGCGSSFSATWSDGRDDAAWRRPCHRSSRASRSISSSPTARTPRAGKGHRPAQRRRAVRRRRRRDHLGKSRVAASGDRPVLQENHRLLRPLNFAPDVPGVGWTVRPTRSRVRRRCHQPDRPRLHGACGLSVSGGRSASCRAVRREAAVILVDMHGEATSEKVGDGTFPRWPGVGGDREPHARPDRRRGDPAGGNRVSHRRRHVRARGLRSGCTGRSGGRAVPHADARRASTSRPGTRLVQGALVDIDDDRAGRAHRIERVRTVVPA